MCETLQDAEQVLRQTFLSAWSDPGALATGSRFRTSLYKLAMKTALEHRARGSARPSRPLDPWVPAFDATGRLEKSKGRWRDAGAEALEEMEIGDELRQALQRIDDRGRAAFSLRDLLEVPLEETAVILETSPAVICGEAHRVRLTLRDFIDRL
jgi:DNA-directed RNA polymerase specialized sigma24 family protein